MVRLFVVVLFTIFSGSLMGQDTVNQKDQQGRRQGVWHKVDSAGRLIYNGHFKDGYPAGEFHYFYPDGKLKTLSVVSQQGTRAMTSSYFPNGRKMATGLYINEKRDSTWLFFSEADGAMVAEEHYKNGLINGFSKVFYPEGGLSEQYFLKMGIRDGLWEQYYTDGKLKLRGGYKAGEKQGFFKTYYGSGQVMMSGQYNAGHQTGIWISYNVKGVITKTEIYDNGRLVKTEEAKK